MSQTAPTADAVSGRDPGATDLPLSYAQEQLWFIDEFHHGLPAHNLPCLLRLSGPLDAAALRRALDALAARHEPLRTRLLAGPDGMPVQVIDPPAAGGPGSCDLADLSGLDAESARDALASLAAEDSLRPFRLAEGSLLRARLARLGAAEHALILVTHQTVFDEASWAVLMSDLAALYRAEVTGDGSGLAELAVQAADMALWERRRLSGAHLAGLEEYWRGALAEFPVSQFPVDRARPIFASHDGAVITARLDAGLLASLRELSATAGTTLDVTLLAGIQALLARGTGQDDVITGYLGAARPAGLGALIGSLSATLPIRTDASGDPSVTEFLRRVHGAVQGAREHAALPFARIVEALHVERDTGRFPLFQVGFSCAQPAAEVAAAGVTFRRADIGLAASSYDISFAARPGPGGVDLAITYTPALFDAQTVTRLAGHLEVLLRAAAADPSAALSRLPVLTEAERRRELIEWNDTATAFPSICIHQGFEEWAARAPEAVAAQYEDQRWSYAELDRRAGQAARRLRAAGVGPEVLVGVCMATGLDRLAVLLGVWKAGGGYVPLDPGLPADRLSFMIGDTGMPVIVADEASAASVPPGPVPVLPALSVLSGEPGEPGEPLDDSGVTPANVAYVIYTSGSTGQPKGVVVEHRQAINFLQGMVIAWGITPDSAVLGFAAYTFDVSVMDMFMPLLGGARVVLAPPATLHSPPRLAALLREAQITFACLPPAVLNLLAGEDFPALRTLLSAGEELSSDLLGRWLRPGLDIYNGYGPTEASIGSTFMKLERDTPLPPPIGRPKPNYRAYVLDAHLNPVPVGVTGELHVGGPGVARGYLNRPELTRERFIADPFVPGGRLYKTGDLVRRRPDGTIEFAGRADNQVKIRGLRVELGEIEAALVAHPDVVQAVVAVIDGAGGEKQLAGYLRPAAGPPDIPAVRDHLASVLPGYMIPGYLITLAEFPLTTNGKVDKAALPRPEIGQDAGQAEPPATLVETMMVELYSIVLGSEQVGATDSFFDLGGSSLQAMRLVSMINTELEVDIGVAAVFQGPAPRQLAAVLRDKHGLQDEELGADGIAGLEELAADETC